MKVIKFESVEQKRYNKCMKRVAELEEELKREKARLEALTLDLLKKSVRIGEQQNV